MKEKKFFLYGDWNSNAGPMNVNRSLVENADKCMVFVRTHNRYLRRLEKFWQCILRHTIVVSGGYFRPLELFVANFLHKRIVYIMHGCAEYEKVINKLNTPQKYLEQERKMHKSAAVIVAVSENYARWVKHRYPQYAYKVKFVNNGLEIFSNFYEHTIHKNGVYSIAVSGGNRPIKCNLEVCKAVEKLVVEGMNIELKVFGRIHENGEPILRYPFVKRMGQLDRYVIASDTEPFGLVVGDGVNCGCAMLMSKNVGAISIFNKLTSDDLLDDNHDTDEMALKIKHLLEHSNAKRLFGCVDTEKCSGKQAYLNLKKICLNE